MSCLPVAAAILAAGTASRMGRLKQLLAYRGSTLAAYAVDQAIEAGFDPVLVVVGAQAEAVQAALAAKPVQIVQNRDWQLGIGSSIGAAARFLIEQESDCAAIAILAADQPLVTAAHLVAMRQVLLSCSAPAVAAEYAGTFGIPAFFKRSVWRQLSAIPAASGAKSLLSQLTMERFPLPEATADVDTPEDWARLGLGEDGF